MSAIKIKKGDTVRVIAGKDKNKEGKVLSVDSKKGKIIVENVNMLTKHTETHYATVSKKSVKCSIFKLIDTCNP